MNATLEQSLEFRDAALAGNDLRELCPNAQYVIDAGAGAGGFARMARGIWPEATIISFEPASRFNQTLKQLDDRHAIHRDALGATQGLAVLNLTQGSESNSVLKFLPGGPLCKIHRVIGSEEVHQTTLDSLTLERVDVLKMDVQGAELNVLDGAANVLSKWRPVIYTEVAIQQQYEGQPLLEDVDEYLAERGYERLHLYESPMPDVWADALYVPVQSEFDASWDGSKRLSIPELRDRHIEMVTRPVSIRLNIGAGDTVIDGFTPIDRKLGTEAFPLPQYADGSVEEIRCVHMLEHLSYKEIPQALKEWNRVLRPGGRLRISVPNIDVVANLKDDPHWPFYLMGGQTDDNDFHKSAWDETRLAYYLKQFGFDRVQKWTSPNTDLAASDISLNLEGYKCGEPAVEQEQDKALKIRTVIGMPRISWSDGWQSQVEAMNAIGIPIEQHQGCFWAQNIQKALKRALRDGIDWVITLDYDSMILPMHVQRLLEIMGAYPHIDACAALQMRRGAETPLFSDGTTQREFNDWSPIKVNTAHFGLTVLRVECLKDLPKPWLIDQPDANGDFDGDHIDADIVFWKKWKEAGKSVYIAPDVRIGHLELLVSEFDDDLKPRHFHVHEWWNRHAKAGHCMRSKKED